MIYTPLDPSERQIRLLKLAPGVETEDISCYFAVISLTSEADPEPQSEEDIIALYTSTEYEALSYVWGTARDSKAITVEGERVGITANLYSALRSLRHADCERILWVDALCINQRDLAEGSQQITLMAHIYRQAVRVLAYLGDYFQGCNVAVEAIKRLGGETDTHLSNYMDPDLTVDSAKGAGFESLEVPKAFHQFLSSPRMTRVWTVQEFLMASDLVFMYGPIEVRSDVLFAAIARFSQHDASCCSFLRLLPKSGANAQSFQLSLTRHKLASLKLEWDMLYRQRGQLGSSMLTLEAFRHREATDRRDRVYGLLGLLGNDWESLVRKDYFMKPEVLYQQVALADLKPTGRLHFLGFCYMGSRLKMPSWVPDWSTEWSPKGPGQISKWQARHALHARMSLNLSLYSVDGGRPASAKITRNNNLSPVDISHEAKRSQWIAYLLTLVGGLRMGSKGTTLWSNPSDEDINLLQAWEQTLHGSNNKLDNELHHRLTLTYEHTCFDRRFATVGNDLFGWVPFKAQPGDLVVVLCGGPVPYVLRQVPGFKEEYKYVGDAYIHGVMGGEAFDGGPDEELKEFILV